MLVKMKTTLGECEPLMLMKKDLKIAIQGIRGSFHHEAANYVFGKSFFLEECHTFEQVVNSTLDGTSDFGIMAIENSLAGCIIPNYNLLRRSNLDICGEIGIRIRLNLWALKGEEITSLFEVRSHQMALRQCRSFLETLNGCAIVEFFDTAGSAKNIMENQLTGVGAIAGNLVAEEYGLNILATGIEDHELNYTRFLILKRSDQEVISKIKNKMSVYFEILHFSGSLARIPLKISQLEINLSRIQSYPVPGKNSCSGFFATLDIRKSSQIDQLKKILETTSVCSQVLGIYEKGKTYG